MGEILKEAKRNWFIGIRTPWTLSSDIVWGKTHKQAEKLFKASAVATLAGILFIDYAIFFLIGPILLSIVYLFIYSYLEFQKISKN